MTASKQSELLTKDSTHLIFTLLDEIIRTIFPEMANAK